MAQYTKRGTKWQARIQWRGSQGNRHTKSKLGFATKSQAKQWAVEQESALNKGIEINKSIRLVDYYDHWVNTYKRPKLSFKTLERYRIIGNELKAHFPKTDIKKINRTSYQNFINDFGQTHAPTTVAKTNSIIRACVKSAILDDYLIKDFTQGVTLTSNHDKEWDVDYLNLDEIKRLIKLCTDTLDPEYTSRYMILTAIYTGMRISEIQGLTWRDVNFATRTIHIDKSWDAKTKLFKPTKNDSSVRDITFNQSLAKILLNLKHSSQSTMVFMNGQHSIPTSNGVNKTLRALLKELKINRKGFHFHSLRHSHVALLLANGIDLYAISKRLGHSNINTTSNVYAYLIDEYKAKTDQQIINALDNL